MGFTQWLFQHFIKGYVEQCPKEGYEMELSLMDSDLTWEQRGVYAKTLEFWATRAFLLGVRTGAGLSGQMR